MVIKGRKRTLFPVNVEINDQLLEQVRKCYYLGMRFNEQRDLNKSAEERTNLPIVQRNTIKNIENLQLQYPGKVAENFFEESLISTAVFGSELLGATTKSD